MLRKHAWYKCDVMTIKCHGWRESRKTESHKNKKLNVNPKFSVHIMHAAAKILNCDHAQLNVVAVDEFIDYDQSFYAVERVVEIRYVTLLL